jgi:hypothetical protein
MSFYTASDHAVNVPEMNSIDALAEAREQRDQRVMARMSRKTYIDAILEGMRDAMETHGNPLCDLADKLFEAPIRDRHDLRAYLSLMHGQLAGKAIVTLVAQVSLDAYQDADIEGF